MSGWNTPAPTPHAQSQNLRTPPDVYDVIQRRFAFDSVFTLDAAADDENALALTRFTEYRSAFDFPWTWEHAICAGSPPVEGSASVVFVNPPFRETVRWIERAAEQVEFGNAEQVVMLVPDRRNVIRATERMGGRVIDAFFHRVAYLAELCVECERPPGGRKPCKCEPSPGLDWLPTKHPFEHSIVLEFSRRIVL